MSLRRRTLDPANLMALSQGGGNDDSLPNIAKRTANKGNGDKPTRRNSYAFYASKYGQNEDVEQEEEHENLTEGHRHIQAAQKVKRLSGNAGIVTQTRPRGGLLGGSLQDNTNGEIGGAPTRSARKMSQRQVLQPLAQQESQQAQLLNQQPQMMVPLDPMMGSSRVSMITLHDRRDFSSLEGKTIGIRRVIEFLASRAYSNPVSEKELSSPTVAMFRDILVSIASLLDPYTTEEITIKARAKGPWETIACQFFRYIRYPWPLSPKQMNAVGSANAWPKFLGALVWLVELIDVGEFQVEGKLLMSNEERRTQMEFLKQAYASYMQGEDDAAFEKVLLQLRANAETQGLELKRAVNEVQSRVHELETELSKLNGMENPHNDTTNNTSSFTGSANSVETLKRDLENLQGDINTWQGVVDTWKKKREVSKAKCIAEQKDLDALLQDLEEAKQRKIAEQRKLDSQVVKNSDLSRIATERNRLEKALQEILDEKEQLSGHVWQAKNEYEQGVDVFQRKLVDLNSRCSRLADRSRSSALAEIDLMSALVGGGNNSSFEKCKTFVAAQQDIFLQKAHEARERSLELQDLADRNAEECSEIERRIEQLKRDTKRLDEKHKEDSEKMAMELQQISEETRIAVDALDVASRAGLCIEEETEVQMLKRELELQSAKFLQDSQDYDDSVHKALGLMVDFKEEVEMVVKQTVGKLTTLTQDSERLTKDHWMLLKRSS
jgi:SMC interacting uncharacterized protein involved in chromosome segregation